MEVIALGVESIARNIATDPQPKVPSRPQKIRFCICIARSRTYLLKLDATPPATTLGAGVGDIEGLLKLGLEILDGESLLTMIGAPFLVPVEQLGREDFEAGCDDQLLGDEFFQSVHLLLPTLLGK